MSIGHIFSEIWPMNKAGHFVHVASINLLMYKLIVLEIFKMKQFFRFVSGSILLFVGLSSIVFFHILNGAINDYFLSFTFICCGIICFLAQKYALLSILWLTSIYIDIFLRYNYGTNWSNIFLVSQLLYQENYLLLIIVLAQVFLVLFLVIGTTLSLLRHAHKITPPLKIFFLIVGLIISELLILLFKNHIFLPTQELFNIYIFAYAIADWIRIICFTFLLSLCIQKINILFGKNAKNSF